MKLVYIQGRFEAVFPFSYETKDKVKAAGFRFDPSKKVWWTKDARVAKALEAYADEPAAKALGGAEAGPRVRFGWSEERGRFECRFEYNKELVASMKEAKLRWDKAEKCWWTKYASEAQALRDYADEATRARIDAGLATIEASSATSAEVDLPRPEGLEYLPYQNAGIQWLAERGMTRGLIVGDEMGLGKTIQALGLLNCQPELAKVLLVVPASLRLNWFKEARKWLVNEYKIEVATKGTEVKAKAGLVQAAERGILIVNYDLLKSLPEELEWDIVIYDEAHYMKNPEAQRTRLALGHWAKKADKEKGIKAGELVKQGIKAGRRLFLTGTPLVNRPKEVFPLLRACDPATWGSFFGFAKRYCDARNDGWGWNFNGASNLEELQARIRETVFLRRVKAEVLKDLPPKRRQVIEIPANGAASAVKAEQVAWERVAQVIEEAEAQVALAEVDRWSSEVAEDLYREAVAVLHEAYRVAFEEMAAVRHAVALAKVPYVIEHVKDAELDKVVVFCWHQDVADALMEGLAELNPVVLTGKTPMKARDEAVTRFQEDPSCKCFVGNIKAAGVGLTLTAASTVVFAELDWVPGNMTQAEDRLHRIGQCWPVLVQHLVLEGSLDCRLAKVLVEKQEVLDRATNADRLVAVEPIRLSFKAVEAIEVDPEEEAKAEARAQVWEDRAEKRAQRAQERLEGEDAGRVNRNVRKGRKAGSRLLWGWDPEDLTQARIEEIHGHIRRLASMCDGAKAQDDFGFNRSHTALGRAMAALPKLSRNQAILGYKILQTYRHTQVKMSFVLKTKLED